MQALAHGEVQVRAFRPADRASLRALYRDSRRETFHWLSPDSFQLQDFDRDTRGEAIWVAEDAAGVRGFVSVWRPENFIHNLFVQPGATGRGIGSALLASCLAELDRPAALKCLVQNKRARAFYLTRGWRVAGKGAGRHGPYHLLTYSLPS